MNLEPPMVSVRDLRFTYRGQSEELFGGLSYDFATARVTALTGPSGRGKSTLLYVLALLLTPTSGTVRIDGEDLAAASDAVRARIRAQRIGFVFQDAELDPTRTILDSVVEPALYAGGSAAEQRPAARQLLERFGLGQRADHRPGQVSGGQAQRVAVCRALINDPGVILADEPTGNLDRENAELVLDALASAARSGRTVVIATHDPFVLEHAEDVVAL